MVLVNLQINREIKQMYQLDKKRAVITGAGSGLGRALALYLARKHWKIGIADIDDAGASETLKKVDQAGGTGAVFNIDVTDPSAVKKMADHFFSLWGGVDLLVNNAGIAVGGAVGEVALKDWKKIVDVNFWGMLHGCHEFIPRMRAQGGGRILNVASAAGLLSLTNMAPYNVTKAAVVSLSETLRVETSPDNICITVACPMFFKTGLLDEMVSTTPWIAEVALTAFQHGISANTVARRLIKAVEKGRLFAIPMVSANVLWLIKRLMPNYYFYMDAWLHRRGLLSPLYLKLARWGFISA